MIIGFLSKKFLILHLLNLKHTKMGKKSKEARVQVILECTEHKTSGKPGTSRYITTKNKKNTPERLEIKKYNPILKKMTVHKEIK
jgi:large subunit ribosomal protein L33